MKLPFFGPKKNDDDELLLALDIGTEYVKSVLFTIDKLTNSLNVVGYGKCRQHSSAMQGAMIVNIEHVISACDRAVGSALINADKFNKSKGVEVAKTPLPKKVIMGIAGELVEGVVIMANYERENRDAKIDQKELEEVIDSIKEDAFSDALHDIAESIGVTAESLVEINTKINATYIDGVKVDNPIDFTGSDIQYRAYSTFAPGIHLNSMREIAKQLGLELLSVEVEPYAVSRALKGAKSKDFSAIIIDIGGGTTDIAVVEKGAIVGTRMFAYGGKVFTKRLAHDLDMDLQDAEKTKLDYGKGQLGHKMESQIKKALAKDLQVWAEGVEIALSEIEDIEQFPDKIYLCGGGSALPEIREALMEHPWLQVLPFYKFPKVEFIYPKQLEDINDETRSILDPADVTPLALAKMMLEVTY
jgi:cell division protein FtsA